MENLKFRARYKIDNKWNYFSLKDISKLGVAFINYKDWSQYTGLKDKNGKEIYAGDIVKEIYYPFGARKESNYFKIGKIVTSKLDFFGIKWMINECQYINLPKELKDNTFCQPYRKDWEHPTNKEWLENLHSHYRLEIIGNKSENPDLLT